MVRCFYNFNPGEDPEQAYLSLLTKISKEIVNPENLRRDGGSEGFLENNFEKDNYQHELSESIFSEDLPLFVNFVGVKIFIYEKKIGDEIVNLSLNQLKELKEMVKESYVDLMLKNFQ